MPFCVAPELADALDQVALDAERDGDQARLVLVPAGCRSASAPGT